MKAGLITGASSGIGKELARIHASKGNNVVLVARRKEELIDLAAELTEKYKIEAVVLACDLTQPDATEKLFTQTQSLGIFVNYLFNNAGFGGHGLFVDRNIHDDQRMIDLNVRALTDLMHLYLPEMKSNNEGRILNTASTAGFIPGPLQATYFATKAYVVSLTKSTSYELRKSNITVTALCPGPVKTEFEVVAGMGGSNMFAKGASAYSTAKKGYDAMMKGKRTIISEMGFAVLIRVFGPFIPDSLLMRVVEKIQTI